MQCINYKGENSNFTMKKPYRHHPNSLLKVSIASNSSCQHHAPPEMMFWEGYSLTSVVFIWKGIGSTDAEAETPILRPPDAKSWLWKNPYAEKDWRQEERGMTEDEMVGWHHWLSGHEFEQALGDGEGHGNLACCSPWGPKQSETTEWVNNNKTLTVQNNYKATM